MSSESKCIKIDLHYLFPFQNLLRKVSGWQSICILKDSKAVLLNQYLLLTAQMPNLMLGWPSAVCWFSFTGWLLIIPCATRSFVICEAGDIIGVWPGSQMVFPCTSYTLLTEALREVRGKMNTQNTALKNRCQHDVIFKKKKEEKLYKSW